MNELFLGIIFILHYYSFALFFYFIFTKTPIRLKVTLGELEWFPDNRFMLCFSISWIISIPFTFILTLKNIKK